MKNPLQEMVKMALKSNEPAITAALLRSALLEQVSTFPPEEQAQWVEVFDKLIPPQRQRLIALAHKLTHRTPKNQP